MLLLPAISLAQTVSVEGVRLWRAPDHTRLVLDLSGPVEHNLMTLRGPDRIVIDMKGASNAADFDALELDKTPISRVRHAVHDGANLRVVLDLSRAVKPRSFPLKPLQQMPDRLVIDLHDTVAPVEKTIADVKSSGGDRDIIIAIDAGHGGEDPGALGPGRVREKDVVLAIARAMHKEINAMHGFKAKLVRDGDYYIPLRDRVKKAKRFGADLFVSIHADAFTRKGANGASVFALSQRGASSETARFLAQRENESDLIGGVGGTLDLSDADEMLAGVLLDLSMTATMNDSLEAGASVLEQMGLVTRLHKPRVEQANFAVLRSPDVPSILVETGFITNPAEAKALSTPAYQRKLARQVARGVASYFERKPPEDSLLAKAGPQKPDQVIIARGDTLSGIAARYNVSVAALKSANRLRSSALRVGQKLRIP